MKRFNEIYSENLLSTMDDEDRTTTCDDSVSATIELIQFYVLQAMPIAIFLN
jgi:hypothetical protein